ncbi:MAG: YajQ family cyclic di-GMP-binding protein [Clostridia bacterium]
MAKDNSFDIVSEPDLGEVTNAVDQTEREVVQRYDFRGHDIVVEWDKERTIVLEAPEGMVMDALITVLEQKLARRGVSLRFLETGPREARSNNRSRVTISLKRGLSQEIAKQITQSIRALKIKVDPQIQGTAVRVSAKNKDDLQAVIGHLKEQDFGVELSFTNYR